MAAVSPYRAMVRRLGSRAPRANFTLVAAEVRGQIEFPLTDGVFTLSGVADRIERDS